jgi:spore coat protein U-like protein
MSGAVSRLNRFALAWASVVLIATNAAVRTPSAQAKECQFNSVSDVAFGPYTGATKDVTMTIQYVCNNGVNDLYIMLDTGPAPRQMLGPQPATTSAIGFELYRRDAQGALTVWTNSMSQTTAYYLKSVQPRQPASVDVVGRVAAGSQVPTGSYVDNLVVRMDWTSSKGAQEVTAPVRVTAGLATTCTVATTDLAFGTYDPLVVNSAGAGSNLDGQATITVTCSGGASPLVWISPGTGSRIMTGPGNLSYELYSDAARTVVWGSTSATAVQLPVSSGVAQPVTVYGRIPSGQNVPVGAYAQTVTVTVNF